MRKLFIILVGCTVVLLAGYAGYRGYRVWRQSHMLTLAHQFIAKNDSRNAALCLTKVLGVNPQNIEASRMMAELAEAARSPSALQWRSRVVELNPRSTDDRLALAQTAMMFRDLAAATNALEGVDQAGRATAAYHNIAGAVCAGANRVAEAEAHFLEAVRLEPANQAPRLNLAVVRLHSSNYLDRTEARIMLQRISINPTNSMLRRQALRELVVDEARNNQLDTALASSKDLVQNTNSTFSDRLLQLDILQRMQDPGFKPALAACQHDAASNPGRIYELANWQMNRIPPGENLAWLQSLPANMRTNQPVLLLAVECRILLKDWRALQASLENQDWGELEFLCHAFRAYSLRNQELVTAAKAAWEEALHATGDRAGNQTMLLRLTAQWGWRDEAEELLWAIVNRNPGDKWAVRALTQALFTGGRTRSLMMLSSQQSKLAPTDLSTKNNLAMSALLLDAQELKPYDLAREVYQKAPTNAAYASTYAFSLYLQGKNAEALKVMKTLTPLELLEPSVAGYYGLFLKATGDRARARAYLDWTTRASLLPEEKKLFDQAKAGL